MITTRLRMADEPEPTRYESIPHAIGELLEEADMRVRIPLRGRAESLNLATAASICLYESAKAQADN